MSKKKKSEPVEEALAIVGKIEELTKTGTGDIPLTKDDIDGLTDAIKELTKVVGDLVKENTKWFRAGKMTILYVLTSYAVYGTLIA